MSSDEILARLNKLEEENRKLRAQVSGQPQAPVKQTTTYVALWKGNPILRFDGAFKPFGIGWKKASIILECIDSVRMFVEQNRNKLGASDQSTDDPA
jgi:hypothetical protein